MEDFSLLRGDQTLSSSRVQINNALSSVRSLSAGTTFPVDNLHEGMLCYRTDKKMLYQYDGQAWQEEIKLKANSAVYDADGKRIDTTTYVDLESAQVITGQKIFDGNLFFTFNGKLYWRQGSQPIASIDYKEYTGNAASATKATQDGNGNNIAVTYATKAEVDGIELGCVKVW